MLLEVARHRTWADTPLGPATPTSVPGMYSFEQEVNTGVFVDYGDKARRLYLSRSKQRFRRSYTLLRLSRGSPEVRAVALKGWSGLERPRSSDARRRR